MTTTLEETLKAICAEHDLTSFAVSYTTKCAIRYQFTGQCHWNGFSRDGIACCSGHAGDIATAVSNTLATMQKDRTPDVGEVHTLPAFEVAS